MLCGIYMIRNISNNKKYVGSSKEIEVRLKKHKHMLSLDKHFNIHLQRAYNLESNSFVFEILEECEEDIRFEREQYWFDYFGKDQLYNLNLYAKKPPDTTGYKLSEEVRMKMSLSRKGKKRPPLSTQHRYLLSEAAKKRVGSLNPNYGNKMTEEHKEFLRSINSGKPALNRLGVIGYNGEEFIFFSSQRLACKHIDSSEGNMTSHLQGHKNYNHIKGWVFARGKEIDEDISLILKGKYIKSIQ